MTPETWAKIGKIGKGAAIAAAGAALTYALQHLSGVDLGKAGPIVALVLSVAANALSKFTFEADAKPTPPVTPPAPAPEPQAPAQP